MRPQPLHAQEGSQERELSGPKRKGTLAGKQAGQKLCKAPDPAVLLDAGLQCLHRVRHKVGPH